VEKPRRSDLERKKEECYSKDSLGKNNEQSVTQLVRGVGGEVKGGKQGKTCQPENGDLPGKEKRLGGKRMGGGGGVDFQFVVNCRTRGLFG